MVHSKRLLRFSRLSRAHHRFVIKVVHSLHDFVGLPYGCDRVVSRMVAGMKLHLSAALLRALALGV